MRRGDASPSRSVRRPAPPRHMPQLVTRGTAHGGDVAHVVTCPESPRADDACPSRATAGAERRPRHLISPLDRAAAPPASSLRLQRRCGASGMMISTGMTVPASSVAERRRGRPMTAPTRTSAYDQDAEESAACVAPRAPHGLAGAPAGQKPAAGSITYLTADLCEPRPDLEGRFDAIASFFVLNDVEDYRGFAETLSRALRPGGRAVLGFNNPYDYVMRRGLGSAYF